MLKLIPDLVQAALETPSAKNLQTVKKFWTAVLDLCEQDATVMKGPGTWHHVARGQVAETRWDKTICTPFAWKLLRSTTDRMVNRFISHARAVVEASET